MKIVASLVSSLALVLGGFALAQTPPPAPPGGPNGLSRLEGTLTELGNDSITVRDAKGQDTKLGLAPDVRVVALRPVDKASIKPGDFVASANLSEGEGIGRSIEMRLFEPGLRAG